MEYVLYLRILALLTSSPCRKGRGFAPSRERLPASSRRARLGLRPPRSYRLSTGSHRESLGQHIVCSVEVAIVVDAARGAGPLAHLKREVLKHMATGKAALGGGKERLNFDERSAIPGGFVFQLADKLPPANVMDGLGEAVVLDHVLDAQTLDANRLVLANDASRELVLVVATILARCRTFPSQVKALLVYSADCLSWRALKVG
jgi:hypothetical protein